MKSIFKVFAGIVASAIILTACSGTGIISTTERTAQNLSSTDENSVDSNLQIAIVSSPNGVDDNSFNEDIYNGINAFLKKYPGSEVTPIRESSGDTEASMETVSEIVEDYDVIVCCGFQFSKIGTLAGEFPQKKFILVDSYPTDSDGREVVCKNVYAMRFKDQESGFLAGMAAAFESRTKKVSVVTGMPFPANVNYQYGFESGVNYANEKYYTGVKVVELVHYAGVDDKGRNIGGNYIGSFDDTAKGKVIGKELLAKGCDVIFVAAGQAGDGVFDAVKEDRNSNLMVIGCDTDKFDDNKNENEIIVLTAALKNMHDNVEKQLENIVLGKFKGENALLGADTDSTGYAKGNGKSQLLSYTRAKLDQAYKLIKSGDIVPASQSNGMTPDDFTGLH